MVVPAVAKQLLRNDDHVSCWIFWLLNFFKPAKFIELLNTF